MNRGKDMHELAKPFSINIPDFQLMDLKNRLRNSRIPTQIDNSDWNYGTDANYISELVDYWLEEYDWRIQEDMLNNVLPQYTVEIDGRQIHYAHVMSDSPENLTIVLTHGWPGSFLEFYKVVRRLTHPEEFGEDKDKAFNIICPSMTGYGWSEPLLESGCDVRKVAERQVKLLRALGIERYGVQGGDWGGIVSPYMALLAPDSVVGMHLNMCSTASTDDPEEARAHGVVTGPSCVSREYYREQKGYAVIQGLKPEQLSFALNDSPVGLAAWIIQCFHMWGDIGGDLESRFTKDELITNILIYWFTQSMPSAIRLYCESMRANTFGPVRDFVKTPTAVALFKDIPKPKREWAEKEYNIARWKVMPSGGHFAALEEPKLLADDIREFFSNLRG
jgi:microsomal epoxide hydrolase